MFFSESRSRLKLKETRDAFVARESLQEQYVLAERRIERDQPILLCVCHESLPSRATALEMICHLIVGRSNFRRAPRVRSSPE